MAKKDDKEFGGEVDVKIGADGSVIHRPVSTQKDPRGIETFTPHKQNVVTGKNINE